MVANGDHEDQIALFAAESAPQPGLSRPTALTPQRELRRLVGELTRLSGLPHAAVNARINQMIQVTSRAGADLQTTQKAIAAARVWLGEQRTAVAVGAPELTQVPQSPHRTMPRPTLEQEAATQVFRSGRHLALQAGAGTGKTTTLILLASSVERRGRYLTFGREIAADARRKFPHTVDCRTAHSIARRAVGHRYADRLGAPREPAWKMGERIGISRNTVERIGDRRITNKGLSYVVFRAVERFCHSVDTELRPYHVPLLRGMDPGLHHQLAALALPYARGAWKDLQNPHGRLVRFDHDHYLKIWAMEHPKISVDYLLLDEAQDTNPVLEQVFNDQRDHAQLVMVGDSAQAIFGWRGARDVMSGFDGDKLVLSQSFRFGPALAEEANRWLGLIDAPLRLTGSPEIHTEIGPVAHPDAILCRTNAGAMVEVFGMLQDNRRVALAGGGAPLAALAQAAADLKAGRRPSHPELTLFTTWGELQEYAAFDPQGGDLLPLVDLVDEYGTEVILHAVGSLCDETDAHVTVSTAHKAKGREWSVVRIAADFAPDHRKVPLEEGADIAETANGLTEEAIRLAYVAVTRARRHLDLGGLAWATGQAG